MVKIEVMEFGVADINLELVVLKPLPDKQTVI